MRTRTFGLDKDTIAFANRVYAGSGVKIFGTPLKQLNKFVVGIKRMGLWNSMVCWPMRSIHNAGTGSTVYSLGGLGVYNGTMVNGPTWSDSGIVLLNNTQSITYSPSIYIDMVNGGLNAAAVWSAYGQTVQLSDVLYFIVSSGSEFTYNATSGVGGGTTLRTQVRNVVSPGSSIYDASIFYEQLITANPSQNFFSAWSATRKLHVYNGVYNPVGTVTTTSPASGLYNIRSMGRGASSKARMSFVFVATATRDVDYAALYKLYRTILGNTLGLV